MDAVTTQTSAVLTPRTDALLATLEDNELRARLGDSVTLAIEALHALGRVHLPQDQFEESEAVRRADDKHVELAPYVLAAVAAVNRLLGQVGESYEAPAERRASDRSDDEFDFEFDLVDGPTGSGVGLSSPGVATERADPITRSAEAAHAYGEMLRSRVVALADRLQYALRQEGDWPLLAELDDGVRRLTKGVQGLLFGLLGIVSQDVRREEILPEYRSAVTEAVELRRAIAELAYHVGRFNAALANASAEQAVPLVVAVADRLSRFAASPSYRTLRADDKKAVIDFRATLYRLRRAKDGLALGPLRLAVEGFSKFLESLSAINHREVLVLHDRAVLDDAIETLEQVEEEAMDAPDVARRELRAMVEQLTVVVGRNPDFDEARRVALESGPQGTVLGEVERWRERIRELLRQLG